MRNRATARCRYRKRYRIISLLSHLFLRRRDCGGLRKWRSNKPGRSSRIILNDHNCPVMSPRESVIEPPSLRVEIPSDGEGPQHNHSLEFPVLSLADSHRPNYAAMFGWKKGASRLKNSFCCRRNLRSGKLHLTLHPAFSFHPIRADRSALRWPSSPILKQLQRSPFSLGGKRGDYV